MTDERIWMESWPGTPLTVPSVKLYEVTTVRGEFFIRGDEVGTGVPPAELHLRGLFDLRLDQPEDVAGFLTTYGWIGHGGPLDQTVRTYDDQRMRVMDELADIPEFDARHGSWDEYQAYEKGMRATLADLPEFVLLEEVAGRVAKLRNAVRAWSCLSGSRDWSGLAGEWEGEQMVSVGGVSFSEAPEIDYMTALFIDMAVNPGLGPFHPRVSLSTAKGPYAPVSAQEPDLHAALCLMIYNDVAARAPYLTCHNEACGGRFRVKEGGAKYGQHRSKGVLYCSDSCQQAQKAREYRRRQRAKGAKP